MLGCTSSGRSVTSPSSGARIDTDKDLAFDPRALDQLFAIDTTGEALEELALLFLRDVTTSVDTLLRASGDGDVSGVHEAAHTIKGCAATFGAMHLGRVAERIARVTFEARRPSERDLEALRPSLAFAGEALLSEVARRKAAAGAPATGEEPA